MYPHVLVLQPATFTVIISYNVILMGVFRQTLTIPVGSRLKCLVQYFIKKNP